MPDAPSWSPAWPSPLPPPVLGGGAPIYLSGEDGLQPTVLNSAAAVTVRLTGRFLPLGQPRVTVFNAQFSLPATRTPASIWLPQGEGWLLDGMLSINSGTPLHGQTWARLAIVRGGPVAGLEVGQLAHGYLTAHKFLRFPDGPIEAPLDGPGALRSITGTTPGAGANISEAVPTGAYWELVSAFAQLTTSATVATRVVTVILDDGAANVYVISAQASQTASQVGSYSLSQTASAGFSNSDNRFAVPLPEDLRLAAGFRIRTAVLNLQAGDQFTALQMLVKEWMAG